MTSVILILQQNWDLCNVIGLHYEPLAVVKSKYIQAATEE